jgi:uncharacterized delta-60 repeat protein
VLALPASCYGRAGALDPTFGRGGRVLADLPDPSAMAEVRGGKLVTVSGGIVMRFTRAGRLDRAFGGRGQTVVRRRGLDLVLGAIAVQRDGRMVLAGSARRGQAPSGIAVVRLTRRGRLDRSFGRGGVTVTYLRGGGDASSAGVIERNGEITVAAQAAGPRDPGGNPTSDFVLARYDGAGRLDPPFGQAGIVRTDVRPIDMPMQLLPLPNGRLMLAGIAARCLREGDEECDRLNCDGYVVCKAALVRYNPDGSLDRTFGPTGSGSVIVPSFAYGVSLLREPSGRLLLLGARTDTIDDGPNSAVIFDRALMAHISPFGLLDRRFGVHRLGGGLRDQSVLKAVRQPDGKIVVANHSVIARIDAAGRLDRSFGRRGVARIPPARHSGGVAITSLVRQGDGKLVIGGYDSTTDGERLRLVLFRYQGR